MFQPSLEETRRELRDETNRLLVQRLRFMLWLGLFGLALFLTADLVKLMPVPIVSAYILYLFQAVIIVTGLLALEQPAIVEWATHVALLIFTSFYLNIAALGIVTNDFTTAPLVFIVVSMATATLLPWGIVPQLETVILGGLCMLWNVHGATGRLGPGLGYETVAMVFAQVASVYIAYEFDRYRLAIEQRNLELRGYEDVVENANDAILTIDSQYRMSGVNQGAEVIFGYVADELVGRPLEMLFPGEDSRKLRSGWESALRGDPMGSIFSLEGRRKDGQVVPIEVKARAIPGARSYGAFQAIIRDVTTKKVVEQMRNDFVAMLSHDLKTPLAAIRGFVEILRDEGVTGPETHDLLDRIEANAELALALAVNFVDVSRLDSGPLELRRTKVSLNEIVLQAVRDQESLARGRDVSVEPALAQDLPPLELDRRLMDRVVANLLSNAIKFSPLRGRVGVETTEHDGNVVLRVRDSGPGISSADRDKLFQRYRRVGGERTEGSGLGLFIVKTIVEAHGGSVAVDCPREGGAIFEVSFDERAAGVGKESASPSSA